jgi:hypothetical protein
MIDRLRKLCSSALLEDYDAVVLQSRRSRRWPKREQCLPGMLFLAGHWALGADSLVVLGRNRELGSIPNPAI